jgi:hypothetical protein
VTDSRLHRPAISPLAGTQAQSHHLFYYLKNLKCHNGIICALDYQASHSAYSMNVQFSYACNLPYFDDLMTSPAIRALVGCFPPRYKASHALRCHSILAHNAARCLKARLLANHRHWHAVNTVILAEERALVSGFALKRAQRL